MRHKMAEKDNMIRCTGSASVATPWWQRGATALWSAWRWALQQVPGPCALCGQRCHGGQLCAGCWQQARAGLALPRCVYCAEPLAAACGTVPQSCTACQAAPPPFVAAVVGMLYTAPANTLILQVKQARRYGGTGVLAQLLVAALRQQNLKHFHDAWVVPVPASPPALRQRGFNPAGEVAAEVARRFGWPIQRRVLVWCNPQAYQSQRGRGRRARLQDRANSFQVAAQAAGLEGRAVILVDDVMTTGATLRAAATALRAAGAGPVLACAVARTPPRARP